MKYIIGVMRPNFLLLAVACVFLGLGVAIFAGYAVNPFHVVLCFIGGVLAHGGVNAFNEYEDIKSGLDFKTNRTPFSGGSGTIVPVPEKNYIALWTGIVTAVICVAIGIYFFFVQGWQILLIGALGLFVIIAYTPWFNRIPLVCLLAPGFGFGTLMVLGTYFALTGSLSWTVVLASFIPFFLVNNLLLLNQFPDVEADKTVGRKHLPITLGREVCSKIYVAFIAATYVNLILGVIFKLFPIWTLLGLISLVFAVPSAIGALKHPNDIPKLAPSMGQNVLLNLVTPVLVGIGFLIG